MPQGAIPEHIENAAHIVVGEVGIAHIRELIAMLEIIAQGREARLAGKWTPRVLQTA